MGLKCVSIYFLFRIFFTEYLRTLGSIRKNATNYSDERALSNAKNYSAKSHKSCIAQPLFKYEDEYLIIDIIPPMELHLILGIVNRLYDFMDRDLAAAGMTVTAKDWSDLLCISRRHYHGGQFIGNHCSKLLESVGILEEMLLLNGAIVAIPYVETFRKFQKVKETCFGKDLHPDYKNAIKEFKSSYIGLGIPVSLKVHIVFDHIIPFCEKFDKGLGWFSEHGLESSHYDFYPFWLKSYKVPKNHPNYAEKLLQSVILYNSLHL